MIGRKNEIAELNKLYESNKAQLVAVFGRRRVGKTFLIDETFKGRITFRHAGLSPVESGEISGGSPMKIQLKHFYNSLLIHGMKKSKCPDNWLDAFFMLEMFLQSIDDGKRQLVFLDELPWLDTAKSGFITAFEAFWNTWGCHRDNLMVVVCGSATSWILDKLINNHGGLYNRVTYEIKLSPFTLLECEEYFQNENIKFSRYDIVQCYMITGGLPYYLSYFQKGLSLAQNIDRLFFNRGGKLRGEYDRLFASIFNNPDMMKAIIKLLSTKSAGYTRSEISKKTGYSVGGTLTGALQGLIASDFIIRYVPFGFSKREEHYKLVDPFCIFYLRFVEKEDSLNESFWQQNQVSQSVTSWRGFAFELSVTVLVPSAIPKRTAICGCISVGKPGYGSVVTCVWCSFPSEIIRTASSNSSTLQPASKSFAVVASKCFGITSLTRTFPPAAATANIKVPASI